jgi:hypothetical protein
MRRFRRLLLAAAAALSLLLCAATAAARGNRKPGAGNHSTVPATRRPWEILSGPRPGWLPSPPAPLRKTRHAVPKAQQG